ncbi:MAG: zinc ribbon domain-containing protein [Nevskiaceae bacterium]|nr:MAG: zinc ribbon domain-containing protein [Nevskiaceae bacterium]TBR74729.1 MAG: zinc ribbon domain-containing protein [Nevskiaceae bacterium]
MPIYEYVCSACGAECEVMQKISEAPARRCPHCGKDALTKEVSAASFRLKGSGWYETDFKSSNRHNLVDSAPAGKEVSNTPAKKPVADAKPAKGKAASGTAATA